MAFVVTVHVLPVQLPVPRATANELGLAAVASLVENVTVAPGTTLPYTSVTVATRGWL